MAQDTQEVEDEKPFRFLDLPPELRDIIYHHLLVGDSRVEIEPVFWYNRALSQIQLSSGCNLNVSTGILSVNKQIYNEGQYKDLLYSVSCDRELTPTCCSQRFLSSTAPTSSTDTEPSKSRPSSAASATLHASYAKSESIATTRSPTT